ncbi:uncharacterized protein LOC115456413 isoform X2 [Manduca sexta]|uniref:uncharacterized protein LOC115456413 isoform X2 n=1 Tax=Manduca sexta TaxID=7130 RepID=UPI00188E5801|nr:uncharacterized protein LOC115456413 isoform X2 [Manduca sexta]
MRYRRGRGECNEDLEFDNDNEFVQQGTALLSQPDKIKKLQVEREDGGKTLSICMHILFGYPFKFECKLVKTSEQFFCKKVTLPLIKVIKDLRTSQTKLREQLKGKDKVIKAYKDKGVKLTARRFKSYEAKYKDEAHMSEHKEYDSTFEASSDPKNVLEDLEIQCAKYTEHTNTTVKLEPASIKNEVQSQSDETTAIPNIVSMRIKQEDIKSRPLSSNISIKKQRRRLNI